MSTPRRNYSHYVIHNALVKSCETGEFENEVHEVTKLALNAEVDAAKLDYKWYMKTGKTAIYAVFEALKQEILRTLMDKNSGQPKTRLVINEKGDAYVLSKAIVRASTIPADYFRSSHYAYHLAQLFAFNIYLMEVDLKPNHIMLSETASRIFPVNIDGDCSFAPYLGLGSHNGLAISASLLNRLPNISREQYAAYNWQNSIAHGENTIGASGIYHYLDLKAFRDGLCHAILKICIMPEQYLERLADVHGIPEQIRDIALDALTNRTDQYIAAALQNSWFRKYMQTPKAHQDMESFVDQLSAMVIISKTKLVESKNELRVELNEAFNALHAQVIDWNETLAQSEKFINDLHGFVTENKAELGYVGDAYLRILSSPKEFPVLECVMRLHAYAKSEINLASRYYFASKEFALALHEAVIEIMDDPKKAIQLFEQLKAAKNNEIDEASLIMAGLRKP